MGFSNQERINLHSKILTAGVKDANEVAQWYEAIFPNAFVSRGDKVWIDPDLSIVLANPASNLATAQANVAGPLSGIVSDFSLPANAIRLTLIPGTNGSTYAALSTYNVLTSQQLDNWVQPQFVPQSNKLPSYGYSVRLFNGDPGSGGVEIYPADGATGTGENKTVGWTFDYANGILLLSADFRASITNPYILGFRYTGTTANDGAISGQAGGDLDGYYPDPLVIAGTFNGEQLMFNNTIEDGYLLQRVGTGINGFDPSSFVGAGIATIQEEGVALPQQPTLNFIGANVTAADDPGNNRTNVTITSGVTEDVQEISADPNPSAAILQANYITYACNVSGGAFNVTLPTTTLKGTKVRVKDAYNGGGDQADVNNITVLSTNIDGSGSYIISTAYGSATFISRGPGNGWMMV